MIQNYFKKHERSPAKRELTELTNRAYHAFGSWNNAISAAGLTPNRSHDDRMYKRITCKANDNHFCDSVSEVLIDNWLHKNKIKHSKNTPYPDTGHITDWTINNGTIFVEYFGLAKDSPRYDRSMKKKERICKRHNIRLIKIYSTDIYPKQIMDNNLKSKFQKYLKWKI